MDVDYGEKKNFEVEKLRLIDISTEDDFLIASPPGDAFEELRLSVVWENRNERDNFELFATGNPQEVENAADVLGQSKQGFLPFESLEPDRPSRNRKCNLRKSLAWDSAFFTSAGVLDPEELFIINKGFKKAETHLLPGIEEEFWRSAESNSTVDSDGFSLESLEIDLFEDVRASIQKSRKASYVASSVCISGKGAALKKLEVASQNMMKSMPAFRRQSINMKGSERITKEVSVHSRAVQHAARSGESNPSSFKPPKISGWAAKSGESNPSSFKSPKISGRANSISVAPAKRASLGANHAKMENKTAKAASGKHLMVSKKPCLGNSCSVIPSSTSPKLFCSGSTTATSETVSCSLYNRSGSAYSDTTSKSPLNSLRRKIDSGNPHLAASGSTLRTPLRYSTRNKTELGSFSHSTYMPKPPSCKSPASSRDGWSSEASLSSSTINQRSNNSKASLDTTPCRGVLFDSDATQASNLGSHTLDQTYVEQGSKRTRLPNQCVKIASMGTSPDSTDVSRNFKPSGLRVPSPKIGFFDAEKSMVPVLNGGMQFHSGVQSTLPKFGTGINNLKGVANRTRHDRLQSASTLTGTGNMKLGSQQIGVLFSTYPVRFQKLENASPNVPDMLGATNSYLSTALKAQNDLPPEISREDCLKSGEVGAGKHDASELGLGFSSKAEVKGTQGFSKNIKSTKSKRQVRLSANKIRINKDGFDHSRENINPSKKEHEEVDRHCQENNLHLLHINEKENLLNFEDQVDGLSRHVGSIDISGDVVIELKGKKGPSHPQPGVNNFENHGAPSPLSLPSTVGIIPSTRTPLAVKDSIYNRSGLFELAESTIENVVEKGIKLSISQRH